MRFSHPLPRRNAAALALGVAALTCPVSASAQLDQPWAYNMTDPTGSCEAVIRRAIAANGGHIMRQANALYPPSLRARRIATGSALLKLHVRADGSVDAASIAVEETTDEAFAEPARAIALEMRFEPARVGEVPVAAWIRNRIDFEDPEAVRGDEGTYELPMLEPPVVQDAREVKQETDRHRNAPGAALVQFRVERDGAVDSASVMVELATTPAIEEAAAALAPRLRFTPVMMGRQAIPVWITVPINFGCVRRRS
jgi:TonB family protein